jgi:hypothetical protein
MRLAALGGSLALAFGACELPVFSRCAGEHARRMPGWGSTRRRATALVRAWRAGLGSDARWCSRLARARAHSMLGGMLAIGQDGGPPVGMTGLESGGGA